MTDTQVAKEKLLKDFNEVVADTEQLLKSVASAGNEKTQALKANVEQSLKLAKERLRELQDEAVDRGRVAAKRTDEYVHENPWQSIGIVAGIAAVVGIVLGLLLNRRN
ncbi:MAG TPA: YqjD family protein [Usitatibacter sp.]|nr:YqjD family protein [Usitatibacter sp.]